MKSTSFILCFALAATACSSPTETREIHVDHYLTSCMGHIVQLCNVFDGGPYYEGVVGWTFEWGHEYELRVEIVDIHDPSIADWPSVEYRLLEVLNDQRVAEGTTFSIPIFDDYLVWEGTDTMYSLMGERDFDCASNDLCTEISTALEDSAPCIDLELSHPAENSSPLVVESVVQSTPYGC